MTSPAAPFTVLVQHDSPLGTLVIPSPDGTTTTVERGRPIEVSSVLAGRVPGPWEPLPEGEVPGHDDGRAYQQDADGRWQSRDPGAGLLAQHDVWTLAYPPPATAGKAAASGITDTGREG